MKTFASVWADMEAKLVSINAPKKEVEKLRMIFYTGAITLMELQLDAYKASDGDVKKGADALKSISLELTTFMQELIKP